VANDLDGRLILVTGGSRGIGLEVSRELARRGARVAIGARDRRAVETAVAGLEGSGHHPLALDVAEETDWRRALKVLDEAGELYGLVTAAATLGPIGALAEVAPQQVKQTISVNLLGTFLALHYVMPRLRDAGGRAVTFSGGGATSPLPHYDAYAASKAAVVRLTENIATTGEVEINCVAPGFVATRIHEGTLAAGPKAAGEKYYERTRTELMRGGSSAREAAELVCYLLSPEAHGISGRLLSAPWDPWRDDDFRARLRSQPELGTLRRIDGTQFCRRA
jgi:NAD(P)-dependent dehydrogenase (short-subunit alcohol dehydrogenase family)